MREIRVVLGGVLRPRIRAIARSLGIPRSTVGEALRRAKVAGVSWRGREGVDHISPRSTGNWAAERRTAS